MGPQWSRSCLSSHSLIGTESGLPGLDRDPCLDRTTDQSFIGFRQRPAVDQNRAGHTKGRRTGPNTQRHRNCDCQTWPGTERVLCHYELLVTGLLPKGREFGSNCRNDNDVNAHFCFPVGFGPAGIISDWKRWAYYCLRMCASQRSIFEFMSF